MTQRQLTPDEVAPVVHRLHDALTPNLAALDEAQSDEEQEFELVVMLNALSVVIANLIVGADAEPEHLLEFVIKKLRETTRHVAWEAGREGTA